MIDARINLQTGYFGLGILFCLSSFYFYEPVFLSVGLLKLAYWTLLGAIFLISIKEVLYSRRTPLFGGPLRLFFFGLIFSSLFAYIYWDQSPLLTLRALLPYFGFLFYFFLIRSRLKPKWVEGMIVGFAFLYVLIYLSSFIDPQHAMFGSFQGEKINDQRGIFRLFIPGRGFLFLCFFFCISNYLSKRGSLWLFFGFLFFLIILMHVIRQYIFFSLIISSWVLFWNISYLKRLLIFGSLFFFGQYLIMNSTALQTLVLITDHQFSVDSAENVRILGYQFFFNDFGHGFLTSVFGNGVPHDDSTYGGFYRSVVNGQMKLYMSDVGYAEIFAQFGFLGLCAVGLIFLRAFMIKVPKRFLYVKLFMVFVFLSNFLSGYFLSYHNVAAISLSLYLIETVQVRGSCLSAK